MFLIRKAKESNRKTNKHLFVLFISLYFRLIVKTGGELKIKQRVFVLSKFLNRFGPLLTKKTGIVSGLRIPSLVCLISDTLIRKYFRFSVSFNDISQCFWAG